MISAAFADLSAIDHGFAPDAASYFESEAVWRPKQVHGSAVHLLYDARDARPEADAVVTQLPGVTIGIVTADCVPVLLAADDGRTIGAVHVGWRGLVAGVLDAAVAALDDLSRRARWTAVLGPSAGGCCYEVGPEVVDALELDADDWRPSGRDGHSVIDMRTLVESRAVALGARAVHTVGPCTICSDEWPSFRRSGPGCGHLLGWIRGRGADAPSG